MSRVTFQRVYGTSRGNCYLGRHCPGDPTRRDATRHGQTRTTRVATRFHYLSSPLSGHRLAKTSSPSFPATRVDDVVGEESDCLDWARVPRGTKDSSRSSTLSLMGPQRTVKGERLSVVFRGSKDTSFDQIKSRSRGNTWNAIDNVLVRSRHWNNSGENHVHVNGR